MGILLWKGDNMNNLNEKTNKTEKIIHLLVTTVCKRNCPYCCNKQYDLNDIPYVTDEELENAHTICITGGEPFLFSSPCELASFYKYQYPNIKKIYVYTNALELKDYLLKNQEPFYGIDGVSVSIKNTADAMAFEDIKDNKHINLLPNNRLYVFNNLYNKEVKNFDVFQRKWQKNFVPADDSIFRKV